MKPQLSDILAILALIISIGSLFFQREGIRKQLLVANINEYTKRYQEIFQMFPESILDANFDLNSLSENEQRKLLRPMWLYFDLCYEEYILYHELNLIDKKLWKTWEYSMKSAFKRPSFYQGWNLILNYSYYPKSFSKFIDDYMNESHNTRRTI